MVRRPHFRICLLAQPREGSVVDAAHPWQPSCPSWPLTSPVLLASHTVVCSNALATPQRQRLVQAAVGHARRRARRHAGRGHDCVPRDALGAFSSSTIATGHQADICLGSHPPMESPNCSSSAGETACLSRTCDATRAARLGLPISSHPAFSFPATGDSSDSHVLPTLHRAILFILGPSILAGTAQLL